MRLLAITIVVLALAMLGVEFAFVSGHKLKNAPRTGPSNPEKPGRDPTSSILQTLDRNEPEDVMLWRLYGAEPSPARKIRILNALSGIASDGAMERLRWVAESEVEPSLRDAARSLLDRR